MPTSELSDRVRSRLLDFAWSQWTQMGVAGVSTRRDTWAQDPEALLRFTLDMARDDIRLFDEMLDWLALNWRLISFQRLGNLGGSPVVDAALAWVSRQEHAFRPTLGPPPPGTPVDLFPGALVTGAEPVFLERGFRRPEARRSHKSSSPGSTAPIALAFRMRLLFGVGSRAEIVRHLLTAEQPKSTVLQVADAVRFAKRNVQEALTALASAGAVHVIPRGNERLYRIARGDWMSFLGVNELPRYVDWPSLLVALSGVVAWLREHESLEESDYLRASSARDLMQEIGQPLTAAGFSLPEERPGPGYWDSFVELTERLLEAVAA